MLLKNIKGTESA